MPEVASRPVEETNSSRNLSPTTRPLGTRLQSAGTSGTTISSTVTVTVAALVRDSGKLELSVKLTRTLMVLPASACTSV